MGIFQKWTVIILSFQGIYINYIYQVKFSYKYYKWNIVFGSADTRENTSNAKKIK